MSRFNVVSKLIAHPELYRFLRGEKIVPINIEISPSAACNTNCKNCLYIKKGYSRVGFMHTGRLIKLLTEIKQIGVKAVTWTGGGEPTLHPDFPEIIDACEVHQGLFTNAIAKPMYDPSMLQWIRVTYTKNINVENLKILRACQTLGICINIKNGDDGLIRHALKIADEVGADYVQVRPNLLVNGKLSKVKIPNIKDKRIEYTYGGFNFCCTPKDYNKCYGFHFVPFIWENGQVDVCAYMREMRNYTLGNIHNQSLLAIINTFPKFVNTCESCQANCKNHKINCLINDVNKVQDRNFV